MSQYLPIKEAKVFASEHGFEDEVKQFEEVIKKMGLGSNKSSRLRKGCLVQLFQKHEIFNQFKDKHWEKGNTPEMVKETPNITSDI